MIDAETTVIPQFQSERSKNLHMFLFNSPTVIVAPKRVFTVDPYRFHTEANSTLTTTVVAAAPKTDAWSIQEFETIVSRFWQEVDEYFKKDITGGMMFHYDPTRSNGAYNAPSLLLVEPATPEEVEDFARRNPPKEKTILYKGQKHVSNVTFVHLIPHKNLLAKYRSNDSPYRQNVITPEDLNTVSMRIDGERIVPASPSVDVAKLKPRQRAGFGR